MRVTGLLLTVGKLICSAHADAGIAEDTCQD
jgi:hypothetical protein